MFIRTPYVPVDKLETVATVELFIVPDAPDIKSLDVPFFLYQA